MESRARDGSIGVKSIDSNANKALLSEHKSSRTESAMLAQPPCCRWKEGAYLLKRKRNYTHDRKPPQLLSFDYSFLFTGPMPSSRILKFWLYSSLEDWNRQELSFCTAFVILTTKSEKSPVLKKFSD